MKTKQVTIPAYGPGITGDAVIDMSVQCLGCKNLNDNMTTCKAFPDGIPVEILTGGFDHSEAFAGDNGIRFEALKRQSNV